ncbi:MAG: ZIP family metal transporter [Solirubrobacterales bacterium]
MEAQAPAAGEPERRERRVPLWVAGVVPLVLIVVAIGLFALLDGPGLDDRIGPPIEELAVERATFSPGEIELNLRNPGPDPVTIGQVSINEAFVDFDIADDEIGRLGTGTLTLFYPWQADSPYGVQVLTATGATIEFEIDAAVETPTTDAQFFGLMALLGTYVGIIPVVLGMLFLPFLRGVGRRWIQFFLAVTIGLLALLAIDGYFEGLEIGESGSGAFGGAELLFLGAGIAYLALMAVDRYLKGRRAKMESKGARTYSLSLMVAIGIGLHNLGEGLAIGSAYSIGALALGAFLVIGFAIHNTTEGLAIVAPLARSGDRPSIWKLLLLGIIAGAPAIIGAVIGAAAFNAEASAFLIGIGVGAIVQVIQQLWPTIKDSSGTALYPASVAGMIVGASILYLTGLLIAV